ncbi:MAG TPA: hypothetical protein VIF57_22220 [Polyangia bacterium]|jgi:hypothetical protein
MINTFFAKKTTISELPDFLEPPHFRSARLAVFDNNAYEARAPI